MIDQIIAKLRELNLVSNNAEPIDAEFHLNELNAQFIHLCEEFTLTKVIDYVLETFPIPRKILVKLLIIMQEFF